MKDFINWLRNNEKIGKVIVWLFIITIGLIILNMTLESLGLPHYKITSSNVITADTNTLVEDLLDYIICILNFYTIVLLVFRVSKATDIFKYALIYSISADIINNSINYVAAQLFMFAYVVLFCFMYSKRNWKYILYGLISLIANCIVQFVCYQYKVSLLNYDDLKSLLKLVLGLDYFIIMAMIILVKELYLKKRGEMNESTTRTSKHSMVGEVQPRKEISKKNINKSN